MGGVLAAVAVGMAATVATGVATEAAETMAAAAVTAVASRAVEMAALVGLVVWVGERVVEAVVAAVKGPVQRRRPYTST